MKPTAPNFIPNRIKHQIKQIIRPSIHLRIFFSFAAVLLFSIVITVLFGNQMMEKLYFNSKTHELEAACKSIAEVLSARDGDLSMDETLRDALYEIEKDNINIMLLLENNGQLYVRYFSRENWLNAKQLPNSPMDVRSSSFQTPGIPADPFRSTPNQWIRDAAEAGVFENAALPLLVNEENLHKGNGTLDYYGSLSSDAGRIYIFLRTPQEPVSLAANLAVKYNLYLALISFLIAIIASYFMARRITKPIHQIQQTAGRISRMEFEEKCQVATGDELEALSRDINQMADKLQDYIVQLQLNQTLLEKDLEREAKTSQLRSEFIANVSHDFKTPLTLIRAYTETIQSQNLNDTERYNYCDIILKESSRMNRLVTQLLQLSRLESGMAKLECTWFSIEEVMREIMHQNQLPIEQKQLYIHWDTTETDHIVYADYQRMEQALMNLLENAIKYTPECGHIYLHTAAINENLCRIAIANTSTAFREEELEQLFISFYKADESRELDHQSFGLGLAIVKATLDLHQQPCTAQNTKEGLEIAFTLPLMPDEDEEEEEY